MGPGGSQCEACGKRHLQLRLGSRPPPPPLLSLPPASREVAVPPPWQTQPSGDAPAASASLQDPRQEAMPSPGHTSADQKAIYPVGANSWDVQSVADLREDPYSSFTIEDDWGIYASSDDKGPWLGRSSNDDFFLLSTPGPRWQLAEHKGRALWINRQEKRAFYLNEAMQRIEYEDALGVQVKGLLELMDLFSGALRAAVLVSGVLSEEELRLQSCRNASAAFNLVENQGDGVLTRFGPQVMRSFMDQLMPGIAGEEAAAAILCANVGLGPFFAESFGLRCLFQNDSHVKMSPEVAAGLLEATMGGVERSGMHQLWKGFLQLGWSIFLAIALETLAHENASVPRQQAALSVLYRIDKSAVEACKAYKAPLDPGDWLEGLCKHFRTRGFGRRLLLDVNHVHTTVVRGLFSPSVCLVDPAPVIIPPAFRKSQCDPHPSNASVVRYILRCVDCEEEFVTDYQNDSYLCLEQAKTHGWTKAASSSWAASSRCQRCSWIK